MRLQLESQIGHAGQAAPATGAGSQPGTGRDKRASSDDSVRVSSLSTTLSQLASDRSARVQQITRSLAAGTYSIAGSSIASAITANALTK